MGDGDYTLESGPNLTVPTFMDNHMTLQPFLIFTTHELQPFRVVGVFAEYLDDAIARLVEIPELKGHKVRKAIVATFDEMKMLRHVL
jgi:hypothetical protein